MPNLYLLRPEVAGGLGPGTVVANQAELEAGLERVPRVVRLEYRFDGWLGDDLVESFPCFIVTWELAEHLERSGLSGAALDEVQVSKSEVFRSLYPSRDLPRFRWLKPEGEVHANDQQLVTAWSGHALCLTSAAELVVTGECLQLLKEHRIDHCEVQELG